jgi:succinate dehydrogenase / fumarate reductase, membrane anchor subunit
VSDTDVEHVDASEPSVEEQLGWLAQFQRVSGLVLLPLAAVVFAYTYLVNDVADLTALDVERRWSNPALQLLDWAFLSLALLHGLIGWHWFLGRHLEAPPLRLAIEGISMSVVAVAFAYGSLAIFAG